MIQNHLEDQIKAVIIDTGTPPNIIVMHPQTWQDLIGLFHAEYGKPLDIYSPNLRYKGIKVLRSLDITEGEFEIA